MEDLVFTLNAILPIVLVMILGYILKLLKLFPDVFWRHITNLCFKVLIPVLLFFNVYNVPDIGLVLHHYKSALWVLISTIAIFAIGLLFVILYTKDDSKRGVLLQATVSSNYAIVGIPLAEALSNGNQEVVILATVVTAICIPLFNIVSIIALAIFNKSDEKPSFKTICLKIIKNPLIIGVFLGLLVLCIRQLIPYEMVDNTKKYAFTIKDNIPFIYTTIQYIAMATTPLSLIALGGDFTFKAAAKLKVDIIVGTSIRIVIIPVLFLFISYLLGFRSLEFPSLIALFATPAAVSTLPLSKQLNGDSELAGQLIVWTSILSTVTLFAIILFCRSVNLF